MFKSLLAVASIAIASINAVPVCADNAADLNLPDGPYCPPKPVTPAQQQAIFEKFFNGFYIAGTHAQALTDHIADDYIQHNPNIPSGKTPVVNAFSGDLTKFGIFDWPAHVINKAFDPATGHGIAHIYHTPAAGAQPNVVVDIYRFNGSCIQEHWDVIQQRPANATNPLAMF